MRDVVWLVWNDVSLVGMFAVRVDAERRADQARTDEARTDPENLEGKATSRVRVEPWWIAAPSGLPPFERAGRQHLDILDRVHREWGLLTIPVLGADHYNRLETYLAVPFNNRLAFPAFQFDQSRELWPGFRDVLEVFRDVAWDEFSITAWFVSRQGSADGAVPALMIRDQPDRVLQAARSTVVDW